jgi:hypothetical protein
MKYHGDDKAFFEKAQHNMTTDVSLPASNLVQKAK